MNPKCRTLISLALVILALGAGTPNQAAAALYADGTTSAQTTAFGASFAGEALSLRIYAPSYGAGVFNTSATFLNSRYAITSAHNLWGFFNLGVSFTLEVADGTNFITNRGNVMQVSGYLFHPDYSGSSNAPDIAILEFASPYQPSQDQVIGSAVPGDTTISAGFGSWGTPATGLSNDGSLRAWDARVGNIVIIGPSTYYQSTRFGYDNSGLTLNGRGAPGDSGGPVFNQSGELIGISDFGTTSIDPTGSTTYLKLASVEPWIAANTIVPEPASILLLLCGGALCLPRRTLRTHGQNA